MAENKQKKTEGVEELLRDQLIVHLAQAGLTQHQIREVVGGDIHRVNRIAKYIKKINK